MVGFPTRKNGLRSSDINYTSIDTAPYTAEGARDYVEWAAADDAAAAAAAAPEEEVAAPATAEAPE